MITETSRLAYEQLKLDGNLEPLQMAVVSVLHKHGAQTQGEVAHLLGIERPTITPRFSELARAGVIVSRGARPCRITFRKCMTWDLTGNAPKVWSKREASKQKIAKLEARIAELEKENDKLYLEIARLEAGV